MARSNLLRDVASLPWPFGVGIAAVVWIALRHVLPAMFAGSGNAIGVGLAPIAHDVAPIFASLFLAAAAMSWGRSRWRSRDRRKLLDASTDLTSIRALPWDRFEHLVGEAFRRRGYAVRENAAAGADRGIDLVLVRAGETVLVQCKRWDKPIGVPVVRELLGAVTTEGATGGVLVTSSTFTEPARVFARANDIELVDGAALRQMIGEVRRAPSRPAPKPAAAPSVDEAGASRERPPAAAAVSAAPAASTACPQCGSPMTRRTARRGSRAGTDFLGCTTFPSCRGTRPLD